MEVRTKSSLEALPAPYKASAMGRGEVGHGGGKGAKCSLSPFSRHRSLQSVLDDAYARSNHRPLEEWLGGILSLFGSRTGGRGD
jgi:hypothetical protein